MKNLEPRIYRQRLVIEAKYSKSISPKTLRKFLVDLSKLLEMTIIFGPMVQKLAQKTNPIHEGYESVLIWAESGAQLYTWHKFKFLTLDIYTCKKFKNETAIKFTKDFFNTSKLVWKETK